MKGWANDGSRLKCCLQIHLSRRRFQVYVLRVDQIINMISLVFAGVEFVLALAAMVTFLR